MKIKKIASILLTAGMICSMAALTSFADNASDDEAYIDSLVDQMKITETVIEVPGITQTYTYLQIADSHSNLVDDDANQQRIDYANTQAPAFDKDGILSADRMQAAFKYAKNKGVTGIWLTGDNLDSASQKNRDLLFGLIDDAKANGIDVTYTMGNHDWNFIDIYFTSESRSKILPLYKDYMGGDTNVEVKKINNKNGDTEMVLLSFNNSENSMTTRQKQFLDTYAKKGIPVIIMQHVPFQNDTLREYSMKIWNKDITLSEDENALYTDANIRSAFELFKSEYASNIVGVFAGHFHIANEEKIKGTDVMQYVTEAGFLGSARLVTLKPQPCETHTWVDATCTEPKTCSVCGTTEGEALGHDYVDGVCTRCGEEDPNYVPPVTALLGDANGDKDVNDKDVIQIKRYISGWHVTVVEENSDIDGVKGINDNDVIRLKRYISGWKVQLEKPAE